MSGRSSNPEYRSSASTPQSADKQHGKGKEASNTQGIETSNREGRSHAATTSTQEETSSENQPQVSSAEEERQWINELLWEALVLTHVTHHDMRTPKPTIRRHPLRVSFHERNGSHVAVLAQHGSSGDTPIVIPEAVGAGTSAWLALSRLIRRVSPTAAQTGKNDEAGYARRARVEDYYDAWRGEFADAIFGRLETGDDVYEKWWKGVDERIQKALKTRG